MKRLTSTKILAGQLETITLSELRSNPGEVFAQVQMGKVFDVTKSGKVIAEIRSPEPNALELGSEIRRLGLTTVARTGADGRGEVL